VKFFPFCVVWYRVGLVRFFVSSCCSVSSVMYAFSCLKLRLHWYIMWVFLAPRSAQFSMLAMMSIRLRWERLRFSIVTKLFRPAETVVFPLGCLS